MSPETHGSASHGWGLEGRVEGESRTAARVALRDVDARVRVSGHTSSTRLTQTYVNEETRPIEAVYVFPLEERAAVCGFAVTIDGRRLEGEVFERDEAFERYDEALAEGHGGYLLDQERPNVFTASVGNLGPGATVAVEITYVAPLEREGHAFRVQLPTTVPPRYAPDHRGNAVDEEDDARVHPPMTTAELPYGLSLVMEADLGCPIASVESPSHNVRVSIDGERARAVLVGRDRRMDRDVVLVLTPRAPGASAARIATYRSGETVERFVWASIRPTFEGERQPVEAVFVVDNSGSMGGTSIARAREAMRLCLKSLHPGDRFNVVSFGSTFRSLWETPRSYDDDTLVEAEAFVDAMDAQLGGTEILAPLQAVLDRASRDDGAETARLRRVVLLTDGQVTNDSEVIALAGRHRATTRIDAFGIGHGASDHLVRGVARATGGRAEWIAPNEAIEDKVLRHVSRWGQPEARDVAIAVDGVEVERRVPSELPGLSSGEPVEVLAKLADGAGEASAGEAHVTLAATIGGERRTWSVPVEGERHDEADGAPSEGDVLAARWARERLRELEERGYSVGPFGSSQDRRRHARRSGGEDRRVREIVELGCRYGLMTSKTSYVVIERREGEAKTSEQAELRRVPTALTRGWGGDIAHGVAGHGVERLLMKAVSFDSVDAMTEEVASPRRTTERRVSHRPARSPDEKRPRARRSERPKKRSRDAAAAASPRPKTSRWAPVATRDKVRVLVQLQKADGYWAPEPEVLDLIERDLESLERELEARGISTAPGVDPRALRYALVRLVTESVLETLAAWGAPESCAAPIDKAKRWLERARAPTDEAFFEKVKGWIARLSASRP